MRKRPYLIIFFTILLSLIFFRANAQCDPFFDPFCEDVDVYVPLDDYVGVLMAASAVVGVWFISRRKLRSKTTV